MTQSSLTDYSQDDRRAGQLVGVVQRFVESFIARREGGQLHTLLEGECVNGVVLEQSPEEFTRRELVDPCLEALGYSDADSSVRLRREPSDYPTVDRSRPEYELLGVDDRLTCVLEVTAINRERRESPGAATEAIAGYLDDEAFREAAGDDGVLAAIGTDGFQWTLWLADLETERVYEDVTRGSIVDPIADIVEIERPKGVGSTEARHKRITARKRLESRLVRGFSPENLVAGVVDTVERLEDA
ncbi:hypothetical protein [Natronobacterium texcoconense]|uniref:Uncharacterized protein n=1 Tax=Natronobacterium texcoconense TaxID=1095778 RepID=A0A1H1G799_NATTX|nr:hypothetical protein [Natronobacterium texcoconense]SDR09134.1 hypothetical protein SAMN04489842_2299 [Natronobacterium texcoconense]